MSRTSRIKITLALLFSLALVGSCAHKPATKGAGDWTLQDHQRAGLSDYKGKVVIVDFYATWCEPCREETPHLVELQRQFQPQGLQVIGLNVGGEDDYDQVPAFAREFGIDYPLAIPEDAFVEEYLGDNENIPQAFVFDRNGQLIKRFIGFNEQRGQELQRVVEAALND